MTKLSGALALLAALAPAAAASDAKFVPAYLRAEVTDARASSAWLEKTLGWKESYHDEGRVALGAAALRVVLDTAAAPSTAAVGLVSKDVDGDYRALLSAGAQPVSEPKDQAYGFRVASLRAPGGLLLELEGPLVGAAVGFQYVELAAGTGASPSPGDTVKVRYVGTLPDGTVFAHSSTSGRPPLFPLKSVIACWAEGLSRMKVGGKARLVCPPAMAFGAKGQPPRIPPGATLTYEIELLDIAH